MDELTSGLMPVTLTGYAGAGDSNFLPLIQIDNTWQVCRIADQDHRAADA